jgi:hypothetical protein
VTAYGPLRPATPDTVTVSPVGRPCGKKDSTTPAVILRMSMVVVGFVCHGVVACEPTAAVRPVGPGISLTPVKLEPLIPE